MTDVTVQTVRRRIKHVESTLNTVTNHLEDGSPDRHAIIQALGLLEQVNADLSELEHEVSVAAGEETDSAGK